MGRRSGAKQSSKPSKSNGPELSPQKSYDLLQNNDKLLRVTSVEYRKVLENHSTIEKLIRKAITIESEIDPGFPRRDERTIGEMTKWMLDNGAQIEGVEIREMDNFDYGISAMKDFAEGDLIISVPRKLMMSTESAEKSELGHLSKTDPMLIHMPNVILALFLLLEKSRGPDSFWSPYIACLPSSYTTVMYFTGEELAALKGSPVYELSLKQCQNIARQYVYLRNVFHKSSDAASLILRKHFTYEQYR
ncbi:Rubisco LSMT substrate-Hypothetical protein [Nesidiocoris tenuis]|uniref:protein-histidine N-methyltransferase n=1 Tax=Nesidiocoris tenuis TaxID=355587 RepID=A0ABN7BCL8_9HEMI|nr:Rubisco LSMT substrate-Hypothetical protein [Nesidiocoris tenuis]